MYVAVCNGSSSLRMKHHIQELKVRLGAKFEISQPNSKKKKEEKAHVVQDGSHFHVLAQTT